MPETVASPIGYRAMLRFLLSGLLLAATSTSVAGDFDARVARANAAVATRAGYAYDLALVPAVHAATLPCVPRGRAKARRADVFTAVARVAPDGRVYDVAVRPETPLSRCFAKQLGARRLQAPPPGSGNAGHPIVIAMRDAF